MERDDAELIRGEMTWTARLLRHACHRALLMAGETNDRAALDEDLRGIIADYRNLWLARNRPGGLDDSVARLDQARADYRS